MADQAFARPTDDRTGVYFAFSLYGRFAGWRVADGTDVSPRGRKTRALLAHLLVEQRPVGRERLAGLLWSESGQAQAMASLRQCLGELRPLATGARALLTIDRHQVATRGPVAIDIATIDRLATDGRAAELAAALADGTALLEDLDGIDGAYDEWLRAVRLRLGDTMLVAAQQTCRRAIASGDGSGALMLARQLQRIEPLDEAAAHLVMMAAAQAGQKHVGHRAYQALCKALHDELGAEPAVETRALHEQMIAAPANAAL